jgi:hypothetical protein
MPLHIRHSQNDLSLDLYLLCFTRGFPDLRERDFLGVETLNAHMGNYFWFNASLPRNSANILSAFLW